MACKVGLVAKAALEIKVSAVCKARKVVDRLASKVDLVIKACAAHKATLVSKVVAASRVPLVAKAVLVVKAHWAVRESAVCKVRKAAASKAHKAV